MSGKQSRYRLPAIAAAVLLLLGGCATVQRELVPNSLPQRGTAAGEWGPHRGVVECRTGAQPLIARANLRTGAPLDRQRAPIDGKRMSGDERGIVGCEEQDGRRDLGRLSESPHGLIALQSFQLGRLPTGDPHHLIC